MTTSTFRLRAVEPSDADWMLLMENDPEIAQYSSRQAPMSAELLRAYALTYEANPFATGQLRLIVEAVTSDSSCYTVGIADLYDIDAINMRAFVGIAVDPRHRHQGVATSALSLLESYSRDTLGLNSLAAIVTTDNPASLRLFENCGYKRMCHLPKWYRKGRDFADAVLFIRTL